jgi:hypothetical protein
MRILSRIAQQLAQPVHRRPDTVLEFDDSIIGPEPPAEFFPAHHLSRVLEQ